MVPAAARMRARESRISKRLRTGFELKREPGKPECRRVSGRQGRVGRIRLATRENHFDHEPRLKVHSDSSSPKDVLLSGSNLE